MIAKHVTVYQFLLVVLLPVNSFSEHFLLIFLSTAIDTIYLKTIYIYPIFSRLLISIYHSTISYLYKGYFSKCFTNSYPLYTQPTKHHVKLYFSQLCTYFTKITKLLNTYLFILMIP